MIKTLILLLTFTFNLHAKRQIITKSPHELFRINVGTSEGTFVKEPLKEDGITLYKEPRDDSPIHEKVLFKTKDRAHPALFYKLFNDGHDSYYFLGIQSKEYTNGFYKVFYNNGHYWLKRKPNATRIDDELKSRILYLKKNIIFYDNHNQNNILKIPDFNLDKYSEDYLPVEKIFDSKWINNKLWFKVKIHKKHCAEGLLLKKPFEAWVHPFDDKGRSLYAYPYKGC